MCMPKNHDFTFFSEKLHVTTQSLKLSAKALFMKRHTNSVIVNVKVALLNQRHMQMKTDALFLLFRIFVSGNRRNSAMSCVIFSHTWDISFYGCLRCFYVSLLVSSWHCCLKLSVIAIYRASGTNFTFCSDAAPAFISILQKQKKGVLVSVWTPS